jgi:GntR family transcriptional regulator
MHPRPTNVQKLSLATPVVLFILVQLSRADEAPIRRFELRPDSGKPIYAQLVDQIEYGVATGLLKPGDRLPTVRELAAELVVNVNTVARAYRDMEQSGLIETSPGRGSFIAQPTAATPAAERYKKLEPYLRKLVQVARRLDYDVEDLVTLVEQTAREAQDARDARATREGHR